MAKASKKAGRAAEVKPPQLIDHGPGPWCEPYEAGLDSSGANVGKLLGRLLSALGEVRSDLVRGSLPDELWQFRIHLHDRLVAEGWRITAKEHSGWKVLPPKRGRK